MFVIPAPPSNGFLLFGFRIYWYGIIMAFAIMVGVLFSNYLCNKFNPDFKKDTILSLAPLLIIGGIFGARLYFCLLNAAYYFGRKEYLEILCIREGGLSIHGALLGGALVLTYYAFKNKISLLKLLDVLSVGTLLGQSIGRWGNYFNSEAFGLPVYSKIGGLFVETLNRPNEYTQFSLFHPTFLYESILNFVGFLFLFSVYKKYGKMHAGVTVSLYLVVYAVIRFFIEGIRLDSALNIGTIPIAQIVSFVMFVIGGCCLFYFLPKNKKL